MIEVFNEIWDERPHHSEVSGKPLLRRGHTQWHWQFSHILPKSVYPKFSERKDNILLMLPEEHELWENGKRKIRMDEKWRHVFELAEKLKQEYHDKRV